MSDCVCFWLRSPLTASCPRFALQMFTTFAVSNPTPVVNLHFSTGNRYLVHLSIYFFFSLSSTISFSARLTSYFSHRHSQGLARLPATVWERVVNRTCESDRNRAYPKVFRLRQQGNNFVTLHRIKARVTLSKIPQTRTCYQYFTASTGT